MLRTALLIIVFLTSASLYAVDDPEAKLRAFDLPVDRVADAVDGVNGLFPDGAETLRIAEVGADRVVVSQHNGVPAPAALEKALTDTAVGGHFPEETETDLVPRSDETPAERPKYLPRASWRLKFFVLRVVANGSIAGAIILLKNHVHEADAEWGRAATNFAVHGAVNGFFQIYGPRVADFSYADWRRTRFFPNFEMELSDMLYRTFFNSWPKRVLCTIGSVLIYRLTDFAFTGAFDHSLSTLVGIGMNIAAALAPAALGLEMAARMGPPQANGLDPRNNRVFDLQNFTISVLFAGGLALNSPEMNAAFGISGVWAPIYGTVAVGGTLWWAVNSRFTNPELLPKGAFAVKTMKAGWNLCANAVGAAAQFLPWRWRNRD